MAKKKLTALEKLLNPGMAERNIWKEDRAKRVAVSDKEAALGRPSVDRMTLSYDNKKFNEQKRSTHKNTTKDWERSHLKELPKSYGRSMDKKFTKWALEQGVAEQDHFKFRKWMDANEYVVKGKNGAKDTKLRSDGYNNVEGKQEKNAAMHSARVATEKRQEEAKAARKKEQSDKLKIKEEKATKSAKLNANTFGFLGKAAEGADKTLVDKLLSKLPSVEQRTGAGKFDGNKGVHGIEMPEKGRFGAQVENSQFAGLAENTMRAELKANPDAEKQATYDKLYGKAEGGGQIAKDLLAQALGYAGPGVVGSLGVRAGAKALGKEMGKGSLKKKAAELSAEGALIGAGIGSAEVGVREAINPEDTDWKDNLTHLGLNVGAGAALDPLIGLAAPLAKGASNKLLKGAVEGRSTQAGQQMDALSQVLKNQGVRPLTEGPIPQRANQGIPQLRSETAPMGNPLAQVSETAPTVDPFAQVPTAKPPVDAPFESKMAYFRDKKNPITEQDLPEIHSKMQEIHSNISRFEESIPQLREVEFQKNPQVKARMDELNAQTILGEDTGAATRQLQKLETELDKHIMTNYGMAEQEDMLKELIQFSRPREGAASSQVAATSTARLPSGDPLGAVAGRIDPYATSPISNPDAKKASIGRKVTTRELFESRVQPAKKLEKDLTKHNRAEMEDAGVKVLKHEKTRWTTNKGAVAKGNAISVEDSPVKLIQSLALSGAKAVRSNKADMAPIIKLQKKYNIKDVDAQEYIEAVHAKDIFATEMEKVNRLGEVKTELEAIEASRVNNTDPGMRKAIDDREAKLLKEQDSLAPYEMHKRVTPEWVESKLKLGEEYGGFKEIQQIYVANQAKNLQILKDSGNITDETMEAMIAKHPNYVSQTRDIPQKPGRKAPKTSVSERNPLVARTQGSKELEIQAPFVSALKNRDMAIMAADRNKVAHAVAKMTKVKGLEEIFKEVNPNVPGFKMSDYDNLIEGTFNGEKRYFEVPAVLKNAYENTGGPNYNNAVLKGLTDSVTGFKNLTTNWNTGFHLYVGARDSLNALANSRTGATPIDTMNGFLDSFMGPTLNKITGGKFKTNREWYLDQGADMGGQISRDINAPNNYAKTVQKGKNTVKSNLNPLKHITNLGMKMEHGPRLGEVRSAKKQGYSDEDAVFEAIDIINYSDQGSATRHINKFIPYASATVRGNVRTLQALKNNPRQFFTVGALNVTAPTVAFYGMRYASTTNDVQRDKINNMSDYDKNGKWAVPIPNTDEVKFIPKGFLIGQIFANPVERMLDKAFLDAGKTNTKMAQETLADFVVALMPPDQVAGYTTMIELATNKDMFTKMPIESDQDLKKAPRDRHTAYTSEVAKKLTQNPIGDFLNFSPAKADHVLKGAGGTLGKQGLDVIDNLVAKTGSRPSKTQTSVGIVNPLTRFDYKETQSSGLYKRIMEAGEKDRAEKIAEAGGRRPKGFEKSGAEGIMLEFKEIQKEITSITNDLDYSPKEKYERIGELRKEQRKLGTQFLKN